jgi:predicted ribosomally synthesized peptide with SipW-like signal peptide
MNKQTIIIIIAIVAVLVIGGGAFAFFNSSSGKAEVQQASDAHEDGTKHVEGDTHQDESKPHYDATSHPSEAPDSTGSERKPAAVGEDHKDTTPHAEDEPHN